MLTMLPVPKAVVKFSRAGMLRYFNRRNGWFVVDRFPMRNCAEHKNCRHPYQLLNADQSQYVLFRSLKRAIQWCNAK